MTSVSGSGGGIYDDFPGYRLPPESELEAALQSALVAVDANVLLNLYRYNDATRDDLLGVLQRFGNRLWVPNQVMREFWRNRLGVLASQSAGTNQALAALSKQQNASSDAIKQWAKTVAIEASYQDNLNQRVVNFYNSLQEEIRTHAPGAHKVASDRGFDPVLRQLEELVQGKVGSKPTDAEWQAAVKEGNERASRGVPPGFRDADKATSELPEGAAGDYLVWLQMTEEAARRNLDALLVTGDEKEDWWWRYRSEFLGPHVELVAEFKTRCGRQLYMMRPIDLLKRASVLQFTVHGESVEDAERVSREGSPVARYDRDEPTWNRLVDTGLNFLVECAQQGKTTTYSELNSILQIRTDIPGFDFEISSERAALGHLLALIVERNYPETNLMISALVTYAGSNDAGPGFYGLAQDLGMLSASASKEEKWDFWVNQVKALYDYYNPRSRNPSY
jgi:hypothetical protein